MDNQLFVTKICPTVQSYLTEKEYDPKVWNAIQDLLEAGDQIYVQGKALYKDQTDLGMETMSYVKLCLKVLDFAEPFLKENQALKIFLDLLNTARQICQYSVENDVVDATWLIPLKDSIKELPSVTESTLQERLPSFLTFIKKYWQHVMNNPQKIADPKNGSLPHTSGKELDGTGPIFTLSTDVIHLKEAIVPADVLSVTESQNLADLFLNESIQGESTKSISKNCCYIYRKVGEGSKKSILPIELSKNALVMKLSILEPANAGRAVFL